MKRLGMTKGGTEILGFLDAEGWMEDAVFKGLKSDSANIEEHR